MRSFLFRVCYWTTSIFFVLTSLPLLILPWRAPLMWWVLRYTKCMCFYMDFVAGVNLYVDGKEKLPDGPCIIAAKHQSWGDGFLMFSQFSDLGIVIGSHMKNYPLVGNILAKMDAIVVESCGGATARQKMLDDTVDRARKNNRAMLIYPEGRLSPVGEQHRYRKGVFMMYQAYNCPVVPVATNLGLGWPQQSSKMTPGPAGIEFLDPIPPGLEKDEFMKRLEDQIETRSLEMIEPEYLAQKSALMA